MSRNGLLLILVLEGVRVTESWMRYFLSLETVLFWLKSSDLIIRMSCLISWISSMRALSAWWVQLRNESSISSLLTFCGRVSWLQGRDGCWRNLGLVGESRRRSRSMREEGRSLPLTFSMLKRMKSFMPHQQINKIRLHSSSVIKPSSLQQQNIPMGLTESDSKQQDLELTHKLIRRYTSEAYGDLTVVQNKNDLSFWALKDFILDTPATERMLSLRKSMFHRSLVSLRAYWFQGQHSLCSNLRNVSLLFEYFPHTLEQQIQSRSQAENGSFGDWEIIQILGDTFDCLKYLESLGNLHLVTSLKSLLYDKKTSAVKIIENLDMSMYSLQNKKINPMAFASNKKVLLLHPANEPRDCNDSCLDQGRIVHQNIFIMSVICLSLCFLRDPVDLGIIAKGTYDFRRIKKRISQIEKKYPNTYSILCSLLLNLPEQIRYIDALKEISYERRSFKKENRSSQSIEIRSIEKAERKKKHKKLSELREVKLNSRHSNGS